MLDPRIPDGLAQVREWYSLDDVTHCHDLLDQSDVVAARRELAERTRRGAHV